MDLFKKLINKIKGRDENEVENKDLEGFKCQYCGKIYPNELKLNDHIRRMHK